VHELSVCKALLDEVLRVAAHHHALRVTAVRIRIGPLSGVEPALLATAYPLVVAGTQAAASVLFIDETAVRVRCRTCGQETDAQPSRLICGACGDLHTELASGDELVLDSMELKLACGLEPPKEETHV
jgi:hydrogenase nickel incorporation protein HypA/HybF